MGNDKRTEEQMDLWEWLNELRSPDEEEVPEMPIANWSYGVIELANGDLFLAEVYWDKDDLPVAYSEPNLTVDPEEGVPGLIKSLQNAIFDLTEDPHPIPVSAFYTKSK